MESPTEPKVQCYRCSQEFNESALTEAHTDARLYCVICYRERFITCHHCEEEVRRGAAFEDNNLLYCEDCYNENNPHDDEPEPETVPERDYSKETLPIFVSPSLKGETITSPRIFSAELECYMPDFGAIHEVAHKLPRAIGIEKDGSLNYKGVEFQTPKLAGLNGENTIKSVCKILNDADFEVNRTTGLHIHLDSEGLLPANRTKKDPTALKALWTFYIAFEDVFLSFLPPSRRQNRYCGLLKSEFHVKEILECRSLFELEQLWYRTKSNATIVSFKKGGKYHNSRYHGVNFHSLLADGHLEIRYHSGTLNATKILEWVNVHQRIADIAVRRSDRFPLYINRSDSLCNLAEKTNLFFELLDLSDKSKAYFLSRQNAFASSHEDKDEATAALPELATA